MAHAMATPRLAIHGLDDTDFLRAITSGRDYTEAEWYEYLDRFHSAVPMATESLFTALRGPEGLSSYEMLARAIAKLGQRDVLDVGCGSGQFAHEMTASSPGTRYTGVDLCEAEIERGIAAFENDPNVRLVRAHASTLPFPAESFDVVTSHQTFNFVPDPVPALAEAFRVLRPGGTLIFVVNRAMKLRPDSTYQRLFEAAKSVLLSAYPAYRAPRPYDPRIYDGPGILSLLRDAAPYDLDGVQVETFDIGAMMTPEQAWATMVRSYDLAAMYSSSEMVERVEARAMEIAAEANRSDLDIELGIRIVTAMRPRLLLL